MIVDFRYFGRMSKYLTENWMLYVYFNYCTLFNETCSITEAEINNFMIFSHVEWNIQNLGSTSIKVFSSSTLSIWKYEEMWNVNTRSKLSKVLEPLLTVSTRPGILTGKENCGLRKCADARLKSHHVIG